MCPGPYPGQHLEAYANELAWRQDNREMKESEKVLLLLMLCLSAPPSKEWGRYRQPAARQLGLPG
jgi:hypothetical protein